MKSESNISFLLKYYYVTSIQPNAHQSQNKLKIYPLVILRMMMARLPEFLPISRL